MNTIIFGKKNISLTEIEKIVYQGLQIALHRDAFSKATRSYSYLMNEVRGKVIYGLNTGFGPMASIAISEKDRIQLQYNLIRNHAVGAGNPLSPDLVKAILVVRLNSLARGYSGIPKELLMRLAGFINKDILPIIPEHGSVGASGDLVQLAHVALVLIGEGEVVYKNKRMSAQRALKKARLVPLKIKSREGLAIMNGTAAMTGIAALTIIQAEKLLEQSIATSALLYEITRSYDDYLASELHNVRPHPGQVSIAARIRELLKGSNYLQKRYKTKKPFVNNIQDVYSVRCAPQILGPIYETIKHAKQVVETEINSVTDNPIIIPKKGIFHGGNFHGDYVAFEMDKLKIAMTKLSLLSERRINFLLNDSINGFLPPFLNTGRLGLDLGFQGMQFVATSTAAENQMLSNPMSIHSIPSNKDNQDIVSMGVNAALAAKKVVDNAKIILGLEKNAVLKARNILLEKLPKML